MPLIERHKKIQKYKWAKPSRTCFSFLLNFSKKIQKRSLNKYFFKCKFYFSIQNLKFQLFLLNRRFSVEKMTRFNPYFVAIWLCLFATYVNCQSSRNSYRSNFKACCAIGREAPENSCNDYTRLTDSSGGCKYAFSLCCNQNKRANECERGKRHAYAGLPCEDLKRDSYDSLTVSLKLFAPVHSNLRVKHSRHLILFKRIVATVVSLVFRQRRTVMIALHLAT